MDTEGAGGTQGTPTTPPPMSGAPVGQVTVGFEEPAPSGGGNKAILIVAIAGLALAGFGVVRSMTGGHPKPEPGPPVRTIFTEQAEFMREAMQMAREAHEMQKEHLQMMRDMEEASYSDRWSDEDPR